MTVRAHVGTVVLALCLGCPLALGQQLLVNGGFEEPAVPGLDFFDGIPGWTVILGMSIEVQRSVAGSPAEGLQHIELDSVGSSAIAQDIVTVPGSEYDISFAFSPRQGVADNRLEFSWDGVAIDTLSRDGTGLPDSDWNYHTYTLTATGALTRVVFTDLSVSDSLGTYLDDVCVSEASMPPGSGCMEACSASVTAPAGFSACWGQGRVLTPTAAELRGCGGVAQYRWLAGTDILRDWGTEPSYSHWMGDSEALTVELRCSSETSCVAADNVTVTLHDELLPEPVGPILRLSKQGAGVQLDWPGAILPSYRGHWHAWRSRGSRHHFEPLELGAPPSNTWLDDAQLGPLVYYDVRAADGCHNESDD